MFNAQLHRRAYKKLLPKWFGPFVIKKVYVDNGSYELENVDGSHIQIALIMTNWKRLWICDSKDGIQNEFGSDVI